MAEVPDNLKQFLRSPDEEIRREAVISLRHQSDRQVLPLLHLALGDESWRVRKAAVSVFREFPDPKEASCALIDALADSENAGLRGAAMEALALMGKAAVPHLLQSINHPDADVRKFVVDILGEIRDVQSVGAVVLLTKDPAEIIRLAAVEALGSIGGDRAFDSLLGLLPSEDVSLQFSVLHALGRLGRPIPFDSVRPLLKKRILRRALFDALGQTRSPESVEFIVEGLGDSAKSSRQAAVRALHQIASDPGTMDLARQEVKKRLAGAPLDPFASFLESTHLATKRATITLLSLIGSPEAAAVLVRAAGDDSIQAEVTEVLARMRALAPAAIDAVVKTEASGEEAEIIQVLVEAPAAERALGPMETEQFQRIRDLVSAESGLYYDRELKYLVERRVQRRMEKVAIGDYESYFRLLHARDDKGAGERMKLISLLSTNETYFFREDFQLRAFQEEILPALKKKKDRMGSRRLKVWSAGCSSGEEPYTIAILAREAEGFDKFSVEIIGSDISDKMIRKARDATYAESSFRTTSDDYIKKYFSAEGKRYKLSDDIRKMVTFDDTNLLKCGSAGHLQNLDVIFCRNVIIYFSHDAKFSVVEQFHDLLNPGGYLLLGHSESLMNVSSSFELVHLKHDLVYRKPKGGA